MFKKKINKLLISLFEFHSVSLSLSIYKYKYNCIFPYIV